MARYLVGSGDNTWRFEAAYHHAKDGDTIEFEEGYEYTAPANEYFVIQKDLTFLGRMRTNEDGKDVYTMGLNGSFKIQDGKQVVFRNIWLETRNHMPGVFVTGKSNVTFEHVNFHQAVDGYTKFFLFINEDATVVLNDAYSSDKQPALDIRVEDNSNLSILDSGIYGRVNVQSKGEIIIEDSVLESKYGNVINAKQSAVKMKNVILNGPDAEKKWPALFSKSCQLELEKVVVNQQGYESAVYLSEASHAIVKDSTLESILVYDRSTGLLYDTTIRCHIKAKDYSVITSFGTLDILGQNSNYVDSVVSDHSHFIAEELVLNRVVHPNGRVLKHSAMYVDRFRFEGEGILENPFETDSDCRISISKGSSQEALRNAGEDRKENEEDPLDQLNQLIGLRQVKQEINKLLRLVEFNKKRTEQGLKPEKQSLHSVFLGNPGTGKTTVARLMGKVLFDHGVLTGDTFVFVEVSQEDLVSENVGGTAPKTRAHLDRARGGVLFIDEAYNLYKKEGINHGQEAIDTIMKYMEDYRDEIMVIFAGYNKEMEQFLKSNPGLESRAPNIFHFEDYTSEEIVQMGQALLEKDQYTLEDSEYYANRIARLYEQSLSGSNGRWIRNLNQKLTRVLADRVIETGSPDVALILNQDIDAVSKLGQFETGEQAEDAMEKLEELIGIPTVKEQVREFIALAEMNQKRAEAGYKTDNFSLHSLFLGNPGTGKTTVARIVGDVLYQKGIIKQNKFVEVSRSDLVAGYVGQTSIKTREVLEHALGGVLFIDEAYTLSSSGGNDFGKEAIDEILKFMEDHRRDIVIIFAGYTKEMTEFLKMNSGLESRIPNVFHFEDYTSEEICQIGLLHLKRSEYEVDEAAYKDAVVYAYLQSNDHSNGRWIRNFNEKLLRIVSKRLTSTLAPIEEYNKIVRSDIEAMKGEVE